MARELLQILLEYERNVVSQTDLIAVLRQEILAVVARHVTNDEDRVQIKVDRGAKVSVLAVDIEIPNKTQLRRRDGETLSSRGKFEGKIDVKVAADRRTMLLVPAGCSKRISIARPWECTT